jgi:CBS domain-containing membrane protein
VSNLHVRDLMTSDVVTIGPDESIDALKALMANERIRHVPVVDGDGALLGLVSESDLLLRALFEEESKVTDIMAWNVATIGPDQELSKAARIMFDNKYGCLPVVEDGVLAGILTEADFVKAAVQASPSR